MNPTPDPSNPASLIDEDGLPMTPFAIDQLRHERVAQLNEKRERFRLRRANQKKGFDEPKVGQTYHVQLDGSISRRTRGSVLLEDGTRIPGVRFEKNARVRVTVLSDEECRDVKARAPDAAVVTVMGAERILEDGALHVFEGPMDDADVENLKSKNLQLEEELKATRDDHARLTRALAEMKARRDAPESAEGKPTKLAAQRAVRTGAAETAVPPASAGNDFGGPPDEPKR